MGEFGCLVICVGLRTRIPRFLPQPIVLLTRAGGAGTRPGRLLTYTGQGSAARPPPPVAAPALRAYALLPAASARVMGASRGTGRPQSPMGWRFGLSS